MDERSSELTSRYLDGDLNDAERVDFERRLETDRELEMELETMQRLRRAVATVADGMEPPLSLDTVMEPLRRSAPLPARRVRPLYRWLGAAAAVVLGVTVALEVARRNPEPTLAPSKPSRSVLQDDREVFELAPLPTAVPDAHQPLGATERLLEEEPAAPEAPAPAALEVVGPLPTNESSAEPDRAASAEAKKGSAGTSSLSGDKAGKSPAPLAGRTELGATREGTGSRQQEPELDARRADESSKQAATAGIAAADHGRRDAATEAPPIPPLPAALVIDGVEVWRGWSTACAAGTWKVRVEVRDEVVVGMEMAVGVGDGHPGEACRVDGLIDSVLGGISGGDHSADLVVRPSP